MNTKPRIVKDYEKLDEETQALIKLEYPYGFEDNLIKFTDAKGKRISALPFETEDRYLLVRMTNAQAIELVEEDDDYDEEGNLTDDAREEYEDRYTDDDDNNDD